MAAQQWCTIADVRDMLSQRYYDQMTDDLDAGDVNEYAEGCIRKATGRVRSYLVAKYGAALGGWTATSCPEAVRDCVVALTICRITSRRVSPLAPSEKSTWERNCDDAKRWLEKVQAGKADLDVDAVPGQPGGMRARIAGKHRTGVF